MSLVEICVHGFPHLGVILQCVFKVGLNFPSSLSRILFHVTWPLLLTFGCGYMAHIFTLVRRPFGPVCWNFDAGWCGRRCTIGSGLACNATWMRRRVVPWVVCEHCSQRRACTDWSDILMSRQRADALFHFGLQRWLHVGSFLY